MADLFGEWVPEEWIQEVFKACEAAPQHRYLFLTKNPARIQRMNSAAFIQHWNKRHPDEPHPETAAFSKVTPMPDHDNWWWGSTITNQESRYFQGGFVHVFLSIEPLMEPLDAGLGSFGSAEWIIIGAETGNRKGKVIPKKEWVMNIVEAAEITGAKVFMKESLRGIMGEDFRQEFPW
jgi:protein gp37